MLNTQTSVDSLPRLRRFNPSQNQNSSFAYLGHDEGPLEGNNQEAKDHRENTKDKEDLVVKTSAGTPQLSAKEAAKEKEDERQKERTGEVQPASSSEVLSQPVSEIQRPTGGRVREQPQDRRHLVEVTLSGLKPPGGRPGGPETGGGEGDVEAGGDPLGKDQKMCCGFFFKVSGSDRMVVKK